MVKVELEEELVLILANLLSIIWSMGRLNKKKLKMLPKILMQNQKTKDTKI